MVVVGLDVMGAVATAATGGCFGSLAIRSTPKNSSSFLSVNCWSCSRGHRSFDPRREQAIANAKKVTTYTHTQTTRESAGMYRDERQWRAGELLGNANW